MDIVYFLAAISPGILGIIALFYNFTAWRFRRKITLILFAIVCTFFSYSYQQAEEKQKNVKEERRHVYSEMTADQRTALLKGEFDKSKEIDLGGLFQNPDYLNRMCGYMEELNLIIRNKGTMVKEYFVLSYYDQVDKIPPFYNWEEWKETEGVIFNHMLQGLREHFNSRGTYGGGAQKAVENEFIKEREKYIKAKERESKK